MKHIKRYKTIEDYKSKRSEMPYPSVSQIVENKLIKYKELCYIETQMEIMEQYKTQRFNNIDLSLILYMSVDGVKVEPTNDYFCYESRIYNVNYVLKKLDIPENAFQSTYLYSIDLPDNLERIRKNSFATCQRLKNITIPESVIEIEENAFNGSYNIKEITIPANVKKIGNGAFNNIITLELIKFKGQYAPEIDGEIFSQAGNDVTNKVVITPYHVSYDNVVNELLPNGWINSFSEKLDTIIAYSLLEEPTRITLFNSDCSSSIHNIIIDGNEYAGVGYTNMSEILDVGMHKIIIKLEDTTSIMTPKLFYGCEHFSHVVLPNQAIGEGCFSYCTNLKSIALTNSTYFGMSNIQPFFQCTNLKTMLITSKESVIFSSYTFNPSDNITDITLIYPIEHDYSYVQNLSSHINWTFIEKDLLS